MKLSKWKIESFKVIEHAVKDLPDTCTVFDFKKAIDSAYPFGQRLHHPYKCWLSVRAEFIRKRFTLKIESPKDGLFTSPPSPTPDQETGPAQS